MGNNTASEKVPEERAATPEEIRAAIEGLSKTDSHRLLRFADFQIVLLGERAGDRRGGDLLNEVFKRLLERTRKWDKSKVDFPGVSLWGNGEHRR